MKTKSKKLLSLLVALSAIPALAGDPAPQQDVSLEMQFRQPPASARPRVWWHWMNGNITRDGIAKDLAWMQRVGIGGVQNFDANLSTPQIVDKRLVYMTPEWKDAFKFAVSEADRLGLEFAIAASPGWSETGGPWVGPEDAMKKLVWSETVVEGGKPFSGKLASPPSVTGPFQSMPKALGISEALGRGKPKQPPAHYADSVVLAHPFVPARELPLPKVTATDGAAVDVGPLVDDDFSSAIELPLTEGTSPSLTLEYPGTQSVRSVRLHMPGSAMIFFGARVSPRLEASDDGKRWREVADVPITLVPTTVSFAPVSARWFRITFVPRTDGASDFLSPVAGVDMSPMMAAASLATANLKIADLRLSDEARIDRFEVKAGFEVESDYYRLSEQVQEVAGIASDRVIDLTRHMKSDGTLDWTPPAGQWTVVRFGWSLTGTTNHPATEEATGPEVDKYDGDAVRRYLDHYLSMYRDTVGPELIGKRGVQALLTDSIEVGPSNWTPRLIEQFRRLRGYDPTPWLPTLTGTIVESRAKSDKFLYDFRRTLADLLASEHYGTIAKVANENGMIVYGEALESGRPSLGDDMAMRSHADIPMSAMWTHSRERGPRLSHIADVRGAASVAHIYGRPLVAAESLTSSMAYWDHSPASLKRIIDLEFVNGINRPVIHTSVHQPVDDKVPGISLFIFGQYFNRHETWAELAKPWVDYISRNSLMLQQGYNVADIGYFYGEEAPLTSLYEKKRMEDIPGGYAWDFVNADALLDALRNDGDSLVTPGGARYRALYLGGTSQQMTLQVLRRLAQLVDGGATIIGTKPQGDPGLGNDSAEYAALVARLWPGSEVAQVGKGRVVASNDVGSALNRIGLKPQFHYTGGKEGSAIPFVHRRLPDGDSFFVVNQNDRDETIEARFRVTGKVPELWRAETGKMEAVSYRIEKDETVVPLTLGADESVHVVFRKSARSLAETVAVPELVTLSALEKPWSVTFQQGRGAPESVTFDKLLPLDEHAEPGIRYFSGIASYRQLFDAPEGWTAGQPLILDLGEAREVAEVLINGKHAGYAWHAPYRVDIGALVRPGRNQLEVRVANLWVNRLIGDVQPDANKVAWTPLPSYRADAPLRRSGLIGPVRLLGER